MAAGVDRIVMLLCGAQNLREITLFPMNQRAEDLLMGAPSPAYWVNGKKVFTPDGKPRQPGALRGKIHMAEDFDEWPEGFIEAMYGEDTDKPWYK
jgi:hypothetical protein